MLWGLGLQTKPSGPCAEQLTLNPKPLRPIEDKYAKLGEFEALSAHVDGPFEGSRFAVVVLPNDA